ncbi:MAG TPA: 2-phosphosulfolactate phosphatase [Candidatus Polarisedimenticolaceae bacterium]|nr:2-phosphosulfolactate phosphatase [Candidatus Polarisedimenticolaceae bacterium]
MDFEVCFLPREATRKPTPVAVLIDVIRASTTIVTLLDRGCSEVVLVGQKDRPRLIELRAELDALVCAEDASGLKAAEADLTPSPAALDALDLDSRRVILATTNGTLAAELVRECGVEHVLIGCMRNGAAVMRSAVELARRLDRSVSLVCAGRESSLIPALDDSYCAAALLRHGEKLARAAGVAVSLRESAKIALNAASVFGSVHEAFDQSMSAAVIRRIGSPADVPYCAEADVSPLVPVVTFNGGSPAIVVRREI